MTPLPSISAMDLKLLGIDPDKFYNLSPTEQRNFLRMQAVDDFVFQSERRTDSSVDLAKSYKSSIYLILAHLWVPYKGWFILSLLLSVIQSGLFLSLPWILKLAINDLLTQGDFQVVITDFFLLIINMGVLAILMYIRIYMNNRIGALIVKTLRDEMFRAIQRSSYNFLDHYQTGDLISRNTADINLLKTFLSTQISIFIRQLITVIFSIGVMFLINPIVGLCACITTPLVFFIMRTYRAKLRPISVEARESYSTMTSVAQENITGMRVVRAFNQETTEIAKFQKINTQFYKQSQQQNLLQAAFEPIIRLIANASMIIVLVVGTQLTSEGTTVLAVGDFFALIILVNFSIEPLFFITRFLADLSKISPACDRVAQILQNIDCEYLIPLLPSDISKETGTFAPPPTLPDLPPISGEVEFDRVSVMYNTNSHTAVKNLSFHVRSGEKVAILGATGSGKSTLIRSLLRLYPLSDGCIKLDGHDISQYNVHSLRSQIGIVPQETFLFGRSVRDNLTLGNPKASWDMIQNAVRLAQCEDFILALPEKYETIIGERGATLSGGQKQRMAIARALITQPKILILDDATSSVDVDIEYAIQQHFEEMFQNATTFIITQRLSTVRHVDRIIVLNHGSIVQMGSHESLMQDPQGIYAQLYTTLQIEERASETKNNLSPQEEVRP